MKVILAASKSFATLVIICCAAAVSMSQNEKPLSQPSPMPKQEAPSAPVAPAAPAANPADVNSIDTIIAAVYDVISGPAGKKTGLGSHALPLRSRRSFDTHRTAPDWRLWLPESERRGLHHSGWSNA